MNLKTILIKYGEMIDKINKVLKIKFLLIILFIGQLGYSQIYPSVNTSRPRITISEDRFDILEDLISQNPSNNRFSSLYSEFNTGSYASGFWLCRDVNSGIKLCDSSNSNSWEWNWNNIGRALVTTKLVLFYYNTADAENDTSSPTYIDKDLQERRINFITEELIDYINDFDIDGYLNNSNNSRFDYEFEGKFRQIADFGAILLDWGYDAIDSSTTFGPTPEISLRKKLIDKLWRFNYSYMQYFGYRDFFGPNLYNNNYFAGGHSIKNDELNMKLVLSLHNSSELTTVQQSALDVRYQFLYDNLQNEFIPIFKHYIDDNDDGEFGDNEGGLHWGGTYSYIGALNMVEYFDIISNATSKNLYNEHPWINSLINQYFYLLRPDKTTLNLGDDLKLLDNSPRDITFLSLFNNFNHDKNKWSIKKYEEAPFDTPKRLEEVIFRDFSIDSAPPSTNPAGLTWFSRKTGLFISKTSFEENATMITFFNSPTNRNNHQHLDNNSFQIFKNGPLFIDSGSYDYYNSEHYKNYYSRTIAHNTITVHDSVESFIYEGEQVSNDGGQLVKSTLLNYDSILLDNSENYGSFWVKHLNFSNYVYSILDASSSYSDDKVESYRRKFLYLKPNNRLVVIDYVKQPDLSEPFVVKWNAHFKNEPTVYDNSGNEANPTVIDTGIKRFDNYEREYSVDNGTGGNARIKTLLPWETEAKLVGGLGREFYIFNNEDETSGTNYSHDPLPSDNQTDSAQWRLEVRLSKNLEKRRWNTFLHTIDIGDNSSSSSNSSKLISHTNKSITINWDNDLYFFNQNYTDLYTTYHFTNLTALTSGSYNLHVYDIEPSILYDIKIDGNIVGTATSNIYGVIEGVSIAHNNGKTMYIIPHNSGILAKSNQSDLKINISPNPLKKGEDLIISVDDNTSSTESNELFIYNMNGVLVLNKIYIGNQIILPSLNINEGIYIVKIVNSTNVSEKKLIVN
mgnify:CR=1 FL=1